MNLNMLVALFVVLSMNLFMNTGTGHAQHLRHAEPMQAMSRAELCEGVRCRVLQTRRVRGHRLELVRARAPTSAGPNSDSFWLMVDRRFTVSLGYSGQVCGGLRTSLMLYSPGRLRLVDLDDDGNLEVIMRGREAHRDTLVICAMGTAPACISSIGVEGGARVTFPGQGRVEVDGALVARTAFYVASAPAVPEVPRRDRGE